MLFLRDTKIDFFYSSCNFIGFCFRLNIFTSKISNLMLPLGTEDIRWGLNPDIPYFSLLSLVAFWHEHNVDEKSMQNIDVRIHVKLEVKVPIKIFFRPTTNHLFSHPKNDPLKNVHPRKKFRFRQKILIQATHVKVMTHVKFFWPMQPTHPRNLHYHATHTV